MLFRIVTYSFCVKKARKFKLKIAQKRTETSVTDLCYMKYIANNGRYINREVKIPDI